MESRKIVVTGFGPFQNHKINASWEAVSILPTLKIESVDPDDLIVEMIPVTYHDVEAKVTSLWAKHSPMLVVHVGVSSLTDKITIETLANRTGYNKTDCIGQSHPTGECCSSGDDIIQCDIDICKICDILAGEELKLSISENAGRFLCEYIFYKSLNVNRKRTMFIHVPPLNKPYTVIELTYAIKKIIEEALKQVNAK